ncbi:MAG TPA: ferredoxin--NADP reductase [Polyangiaceae bacterium]|nr:ferredoxin--NADP reductase [Polyangiaceae bacterium]
MTEAARSPLLGFREGRVIARREWSSSLITLTVSAEIAPFFAGQFVHLGLTVNGQFLQRPYSLASAPGTPLEFYLTAARHAALTPALFELGVGEALHVEERARGAFTLEHVPNCRTLWMIATGTGLGPFIAMLRTPLPWQRAERIVLVHGTRDAAQQSYAEELELLQQTRERRFTRVPIVSRENVAGALSGRVTSAIEDGSLEQRAEARLDATSSHVMLCGNPPMVAEMLSVLESRGLNRHRPGNPGQISTER